MLGDVVGAEDKAPNMVLSIDDQLEQLAQIDVNIPDDERIRVADYAGYHPSVVYNQVLAGAAGVISDGGSVFVPNIFGEEIDKQLLAEWNPDLITFRPYYTDTDGSLYDLGDDCVNEMHRSLLEVPELADTSAVKNGKSTRFACMNLSLWYKARLIWHGLLTHICSSHRANRYTNAIISKIKQNGYMPPFQDLQAKIRAACRAREH